MFTAFHITFYGKEKCPLLDLHDKPTMTPNIFNAGYNALCTEKKKSTEILTLKCWVQSHITTYFNVSNVGFARQTNTDSKTFNAGSMLMLFLTVNVHCSPQLMHFLTVNVHCSPQLMHFLTVNVHCSPQLMHFLTVNVRCCPQLMLF